MPAVTYRTRVVIALVLQSTAVLVLVVALAGGTWLDARVRPRVAVLVDRSSSMPGGETDAAAAKVLRDAERAGTVDVIEFAGNPRTAASDAIALDRDATNIEAAIDLALEHHAASRLAAIAVISDGFETAGHAERALQAAREAGLDVQWMTVPAAAPIARIASVLAPDRITIGRRVAIGVRSTGDHAHAMRVRLIARSTSGEEQQAAAELDREGRATLLLDARKAGAMVVDAMLEDVATGASLHRVRAAAVIDVVPAARMLYVQGGAGVLASSLRAGGWDLDAIMPARADAYADVLDTYDVLVLDDVAIADASPRFWRALVDAVQHHGTGLAVLGGERAFGRGGYRESELEAVLPVASEPAARVQPVDIVFAVDKSGSMGEGTGGVNRFQLAQRAVVDTARALGVQDSFGVVVFDVGSRVLMPLARAHERRDDVAREWPVTPAGGTRISPAIDDALREFARSANARRILVLVTDGFLDDAPIASLRRRLESENVETIAIAVGPDADMRSLRDLVGADGMLLHVKEAAELPVTMRAGVERRRARVERGVIAVEQRADLPFAPRRPDHWPAISAHAVTRAQPGASIAIETRAGDPVLAWQRSGQGRVIAVTSGIGPWTAAWLSMREWPQFAGGLAAWLARDSVSAHAVSLVETAEGMRIDADVAFAGRWQSSAHPVVSVRTPDAREHAPALRESAPGRFSAVMPDYGTGLYTVTFSTDAGSTRVIHVRSSTAEADSAGVSPSLQTWKGSGLIRDWQPGALAHARRHDGSNALDRTLVGLALVLSLAGILVERGAAPWAFLRNGVMRRLRKPR